jgi:hypothetical protein
VGAVPVEELRGLLTGTGVDLGDLTEGVGGA